MPAVRYVAYMHQRIYGIFISAEFLRTFEKAHIIIATVISSSIMTISPPIKLFIPKKTGDHRKFTKSCAA
jgi:hypothetical protein